MMRNHFLRGSLSIDTQTWPLLWAASGDGEKETVRARRRRRSGPAGSEDRKRAEAPQRRKPGPSPSRPAGGGGTGGGIRPPVFSGGGGKGKPSLLMIGIFIILFLCALPIVMFFGPDDSGEISQQEAPDFAVEQPTPTAVPLDSVQLDTPLPAGEGDTWLVMLYQDADDKILEEDIYLDLNEAERVGSSDNVHIVAQVDRFRAGYRGDGDWSAAKRFYITYDNDLQRIQSQQLADLGEVNMADSDTLVDFVSWAIETFPADKHALIMSDHGIGWPGGWSDSDSGGSGDRALPLASALGDQLYLMELDNALAEIRARTGLDKLELIGMDACLMGHLEVFSALAPHARYAVASQEVEPALGWAYTGFLQALRQNPNMSGADLSRAIVQSYIEDDQRIVDDQARADFLRQGSPMGGLFGMLGGPSAAQLTQQLGQGVTLTAVDLAEMPVLIDSVNQFSFDLQTVNQRNVAQARTYAQSFTSPFGTNVPPSYIDLGNFVQLLKRESGSQTLAQSADRVLTALDTAVIAEKHGPKKPGATGVSVYFPNSQLYGSPMTGPQSYTVAARRFADDSLWDDFLTFHYTGRPFELTPAIAVVPERGVEISGPGAEVVSISPVSLSANVAAPGRPILLSADIRGQNIGYVYLFAGFYDQAANAIFIADTDYLESNNTRELNGVYYPVWSEQAEFTMEFEWEPIVFAVNDGVNSVVAHFAPQSYGASFEEAAYTVDGIYTYGDGEGSRPARLYFNNGFLTQVVGFTGDETAGAPREIVPQTGDTFTILEEWLDLSPQGQPMQVARQAGGTLTFGDQMFTWEELDAAPGNYLVGFVVEDLDGNKYESYEQVRVE
jgi:hypothetical protein